MAKVTAPDGTTITFPDGTDPEQMNRVMAEYWAKNGNTLEAKGELGSARANAFLQGSLAGFGDEASGVIGATADKLIGNDFGQSWETRYKGYRDKSRAEFEKYRAERPWESFGVTAASGALPALATGGTSTATTVGGQLLSGAKTGAVWGAVAGFGSGEGDILEGDPGRLVGAGTGAAFGAGLGAGATAAAPHVVNALKWVVGRLPRAFDSSGQLSAQAKAALKQIGLDPNDITQDVIRAVRSEGNRALNIDDLAGNIRLAEAQSLPVPVPQLRGMVTQSAPQQMTERQMAGGQYGEFLEGLMKGGYRSSTDALEANIPAIQGKLSANSRAPIPAGDDAAKFNKMFGAGGAPERAAVPVMPGQPQVTQVGQGGEIVANRLQGMYSQKKAQVDSLYEIAKSGPSAGAPAGNVSAAAYEMGLRLGKDYSPATAPRVHEVLQNLEKYRKQAPADAYVLARELVDKRSALSNLTQSTDRVEAKAAGEAVKMYDEFLNGLLDRELLSGNKKAIADFQSAIAGRRELGKVFEGHDLVHSLTEMDYRSGQRVFAVAPEDAANIILGRTGIPNLNKANLARDLHRLHEVLGKGSAEWNALREEVFLRFAEVGRNGARKGDQMMFSGANLNKAWENAKLRSGRVMQALFTPEETALISQWARVAQRTTTAVEGGAPQGSAPALMNAMRKLAGASFAGPRLQALIAMMPGGKMVSNMAMVPSAFRALRPKVVTTTPVYRGAARAAAGVGEQVRE